MPEYVVMYKNENGHFEERGRGVAPSRERAIEAIADREGVWVAITEGQLAELVVEPTHSFRVVHTQQRREA